MKLSKWQALTRWLSKHPTFTWSQLNKAFGYRPTSLNSYTTYLNTLRRAGFVVQTARGQYKVLDPKYIATVSRREITQYIDLETAAELLRSAQDFGRDTLKNLRAQEQKSKDLALLVERSVTVGELAAARAVELSNQVIRMDARAVGTRWQRIKAVVLRELRR